MAIVRSARGVHASFDQRIARTPMSHGEPTMHASPVETPPYGDQVSQW